MLGAATTQKIVTRASMPAGPVIPSFPRLSLGRIGAGASSMRLKWCYPSNGLSYLARITCYEANQSASGVFRRDVRWRPALPTRASMRTRFRCSRMRAKARHFFKTAMPMPYFQTSVRGDLSLAARSAKAMVYAQGQLVGDTTMKQLSVGFQAGGKDYSQIIFFQGQTRARPIRVRQL